MKKHWYTIPRSFVRRPCLSTKKPLNSHYPWKRLLGTEVMSLKGFYPGQMKACVKAQRWDSTGLPGRRGWACLPTREQNRGAGKTTVGIWEAEKYWGRGLSPSSPGARAQHGSVGHIYHPRCLGAEESDSGWPSQTVKEGQSQHPADSPSRGGPHVYPRLLSPWVWRRQQCALQKLRSDALLTLTLAG